jgi:hypothetical protein
LVTAGAGLAAEVAGTFHIAVGQELLLSRGIPLQGGFSIEVTILLQGKKKLIGDIKVIAGVGRGEEVISQPQALE